MGGDAEQGAVPTASASRGRLVARLVSGQRRRAMDAALAAGQARQVAADELLAAEKLLGLARISLALLVATGVGFGALEVAVRVARRAGPLLRNGNLGWRLAALVVGNIALYLVMLPLHEAAHGAVILALGGRPTFGLRLPLAAYCTAPGQLFTRAGYAAVALAPLMAISVAGALAIWLAPDVGAYLIFPLAGNVSGAVGDLAVVRSMCALPAGALIADTATGYEAYVITDR